MRHTGTRRSALAAAVGFALLLTPSPALAVAPVDGGGFATFWAVTINDGPGDHYDPHVSGDLVSYTAPDGIHLYDFVTGTETIVPTGPDGVDQLSDVSGGRIVFTRWDVPTFDFTVRTYDVASGAIDFAAPDLSLFQGNAAVGGDTVALIDFDPWPSELFAVRPGSSVTRLTADTRYDQAPDVDDSGNLIVWQSCAEVLSNCDIRQAAWNGSAWSITHLTDNTEPESDAATDGSIVAYAAQRSGEWDIYWQPVGGGTEHRLELPGHQSNPNVSSGLILFESAAPGAFAADVYLYQVATSSLFQVTSTPSYEMLNDIDALPDGRVRLVWTSGSEGERDVYGATIELPPAGPSYSFGGFQAPVEPRPTLNSMKAGAAVPVKFSLGGDQGLAIFDSGYPRSQGIACDSTADVDPIEQTVTAGGSSLTYDPATDTYSYVWKTDKAWKGTCRQLVLGFADGSFARANFVFK